MRRLWQNRQMGKMQSLQVGIPPRWGCWGLQTPQRGELEGRNPRQSR